LRNPKFSRFDTIPECDRHTHTDRHTTTAYTTLSIASRGKNCTDSDGILCVCLMCVIFAARCYFLSEPELLDCMLQMLVMEDAHSQFKCKCHVYCYSHHWYFK